MLIEHWGMLNILPLLCTPEFINMINRKAYLQYSVELLHRGKYALRFVVLWHFVLSWYKLSSLKHDLDTLGAYEMAWEAFVLE